MAVLSHVRIYRYLWIISQRVCTVLYESRELFFWGGGGGSVLLTIIELGYINCPLGTSRTANSADTMMLLHTVHTTYITSRIRRHFSMLFVEYERCLNMFHIKVIGIYNILFHVGIDCLYIE
jgi:hypothetical protein